jgi:hypothetical protein
MELTYLKKVQKDGRRVAPVRRPPIDISKRFQPVLLHLPWKGRKKWFSGQFCRKAFLLKVFRVLNTRTVPFGPNGVDRAAIRASPSFYP